MFCRECGLEIPDDSKFCNSCGTKVVIKKDINLIKNDTNSSSIPKSSTNNKISEQNHDKNTELPKSELSKPKYVTNYSSVKKEQPKKGIGCLGWFFIIIIFFYVITKCNSNNEYSAQNTSSYTIVNPNNSPNIPKIDKQITQSKFNSNKTEILKKIDTLISSGQLNEARKTLNNYTNVVDNDLNALRNKFQKKDVIKDFKNADTIDNKYYILERAINNYPNLAKDKEISTLLVKTKKQYVKSLLNNISQRKKYTYASASIVTNELKKIDPTNSKKYDKILESFKNKTSLSSNNKKNSKMLEPTMKVLVRTPSGDKGKYYLLATKNLQHNIKRTLHQRDGVGYTGYTLMEINCSNYTIKELGYTEDSLDSMNITEGNWYEIIPGSSKSFIALAACLDY